MQSAKPQARPVKFVHDDHLKTEEDLPYLDGSCAVVVHQRNEPSFFVNAGDKIDLDNDFTEVGTFAIGTYGEGDAISAMPVFSHVFFRTNHIESDWTQADSMSDISCEGHTEVFVQMLNASSNARSTSVGDVYEVVWTGYEGETVSDFYIVDGCGWKTVSGAGDHIW